MNYYVVFDGKSGITISNNFDSAADLRMKYISNPSSLVRTFGTLQEATNFAEGLIKPVEPVKHKDKKQKTQEDVVVERTLKIFFRPDVNMVTWAIEDDDEIFYTEPVGFTHDNLRVRMEEIEKALKHAQKIGITHLKALINDEHTISFVKGELRLRSPISCQMQDQFREFCKKNFQKIDFEYYQ